MNSSNTTVIICCAGMGTRLGIGTTKALVNLGGKPLIIRLLENLNEFDDVRIIAGYQAERVIDIVSRYRKDILFAFNYDYEVTGPAASMWKGLKYARENVIILDGDLVVEPNSFRSFLNYNDECIAYTNIFTDETISLNIHNNLAYNFSDKPSHYIWPGIIKIKSKRINKGKEYIFETLSKCFPLKAIEVKAMEIDTQDDYENVVAWINSEYKGD